MAHNLPLGRTRDPFVKAKNYLMKKAITSICFILVATGLSLLSVLYGASPLFADSNEDVHEPTSSSDRDKTVSLLQIIKTIERDFPGRLLEIELENERIGGSYILVYDAKVLTPSGDVLKLYYDAKTSKLLKFKGHHQKARTKKRTGRSKYRRKKQRKRDDDDDDDHGRKHDDD